MSEGPQNDPDEIYTFTATVAKRWGNGEVQIVPDDIEELLAFFRRQGIRTRLDWNEDGDYVTVRPARLLARIEGARRVRHSVRAKTTQRGREVWAVDIEPIQ